MPILWRLIARAVQSVVWELTFEYQFRFELWWFLLGRHPFLCAMTFAPGRLFNAAAQ